MPPPLSTHMHTWWWWLFPRVRGFEDNVRQFIPRLRFKKKIKVEISSRTLISLFRTETVHSGSASWDDCVRVFPGEVRVSSFSDRFPHSARTAAQSAHPDFDGSRVYACFIGVTCHLHFWQNDRGLLRATAVTRGWYGHRTWVSTQSWLWRKNSPAASAGIRTRNLSVTSRGAVTNKLSRLSSYTHIALLITPHTPHHIHRTTYITTPNVHRHPPHTHTHTNTTQVCSFRQRTETKKGF